MHGARVVVWGLLTFPRALYFTYFTLIMFITINIVLSRQKKIEILPAKLPVLFFYSIKYHCIPFPLSFVFPTFRDLSLICFFFTLLQFYVSTHRFVLAGSNNELLAKARPHGMLQVFTMSPVSHVVITYFPLLCL